MLMTRHFDYCPSASEGDNQSVRSSAPVVSRCFPGGYNVKLYISRGRLAWWLLAFLHSDVDLYKCSLATHSMSHCLIPKTDLYLRWHDPAYFGENLYFYIFVFLLFIWSHDDHSS